MEEVIDAGVGQVEVQQQIAQQFGVARQSAQHLDDEVVHSLAFHPAALLREGTEELAGVMDRFAFIKYGLASVLVFVGLKMVWLNEAFGGKFPISWSLLIIGSLIGLSILASMVIDKISQKKLKFKEEGI